MRLKQTLILILICCSCTSYKLTLEERKLLKIHTLEDYRQLDSNRWIKDQMWIYMFNSATGDYFTDIDLLLKNKKELKKEDKFTSYFYYFMKLNKKNLKLYMDPADSSIVCTFKDSIIFGKWLSEDLQRQLEISTYSNLRRMFSVVDKHYRVITFYKDDEDSKDVLKNLRVPLYDIFDKYAKDPDWQIDTCYSSWQRRTIRNDIILKYDPVYGMGIHKYCRLDNVTFRDEYFREIADLFEKLCKKYKLRTIYAWAPVYIKKADSR